MTWLLLITVVIISTCSEGFQFCPPARPPVISQQVFADARGLSRNGPGIIGAIFPNVASCCVVSTDDGASHHGAVYPASQELGGGMTTEAIVWLVWGLCLLVTGSNWRDCTLPVREGGLMAEDMEQQVNAIFPAQGKVYCGTCLLLCTSALMTQQHLPGRTLSPCQCQLCARNI